MDGSFSMIADGSFACGRARPSIAGSTEGRYIAYLTFYVILEPFGNADVEKVHAVAAPSTF